MGKEAKGRRYFSLVRGLQCTNIEDQVGWGLTSWRRDKGAPKWDHGECLMGRTVENMNDPLRVAL